jgi:uncharacterized protein with ParB-like and HNH nuclease domain
MSTQGFNLDADDYDISEVLEGSHQIEVPDYQREYAWGTDQWSELWDDIYALTRDRNNHFIGSIVVIERRDGNIKKFELVDGQQRLTTISIILCAIRDRFEQEEEYKDIAGFVQEFLEIQSRTTGKDYQKLKLNKFHNPDYKKVLEGNTDLLDDSQIGEAYNYYIKKLAPLGANKVQDIYDELIHSINLVQIECGSEISAFRLFESLNDKGLDLGAVDLVKNRLFMEANENSVIDETRVKNLWEEIMTVIRPELSQNYRFFTHYFMSISTPQVNDNVSKRKLYDYVDELLEHKLEEEDIAVEEILEDMLKKAELYVDIVNGEVSNGYKPRKLQELNSKLVSTQIKNNRIRTLLLKIVSEYDDADDVIEALNILEVFNIRAKIGGRDSNTSRDRFWSRTCAQMDRSNDPNRYLRRVMKDRAPTDTILKEKIPNREFKTNDFTKYILDRIEEEHYMRAGSGKGVQDRSTVDIEHIAPRQVWNADKYSSWIQYLDCSEEEFEEYKNRIGNLTLLENSVNQTASDRPFKQKCDIYKERTDFLMTQAIAEEYNKWGIEKITGRSENMADIICEIWSVQNV